MGSVGSAKGPGEKLTSNATGGGVGHGRWCGFTLRCGEGRGARWQFELGVMVY